MANLKTSAITILSLLVCLCANAQEVRLFRTEVYGGIFDPIKQTLNYEQIEGSPYLNEDLIMGYVKFNFGDSSVHYMRYNIYNDAIEYLKDEKLYAIDNEEALNRVFIDGHTFNYSTYQIRNKFKKGYLEKLVSGSCELFVKHGIAFEEAENAQSAYDRPKPPTFSKKPSEYFYSCNNQPIKGFENNNDGLSVVVGSYDVDLKKFIKQQKLKLRKQEDLIKVFEYYNSIL